MVTNTYNGYNSWHKGMALKSNENDALLTTCSYERTLENKSIGDEHYLN